MSPPLRQDLAGFLASPAQAGRRAWILDQAERQWRQPFPALTASAFLAYTTQGSRTIYETPFFARRQMVGWACLAAAIEPERWNARIVDALWAICDEATWVVPAHASYGTVGARPLPLGEAEFVDLFSAETAAVLAAAVRLMGPSLGLASEALRQRVSRCIDQRIIQPATIREDFWWWSGRNNWTPWIAGNLLGALADLDVVPPAGLLDRIEAACRRFMAGYGDDGGCDEGVMYWNVAAGALLCACEESTRLGRPMADWYAEPRLRAMLTFPARVHLGHGWFPSFADARPFQRPRRYLLARAAAITGDPGMHRLSALAARGWRQDGPVLPALGVDHNGGDLLDALRELAWAVTDPPTPAGTEAEDDWLADLQWMVARHQGLSVAAKAGHNGENHNHNDVGQFMIVCDGRPLIVDAGIGVYSAATFGPDRMAQPWIRSGDHAVPIINGVGQAHGRAYAARAVAHARTGRTTSLDMELAGAYPPAAGLTRLRRTIRVDRAADTITVADRATCGGGPVDYRLPILSPVRPVREGDAIILRPAGGGRGLAMTAPGCAVAISEDALDDPIMASTWGGVLHRLTVTAAATGGDAAVEVRFQVI